MIDNLKLISPLLKFESNDVFYHLDIIKRKKDIPDLATNSHIVKSYHIRSLKHLDDIYSEVKLMCDTFNARAFLRLNRRSFESVGLENLKHISTYLSGKDYVAIRNAYTRSCHKVNSQKPKRWIVDIDKEDIENYGIKAIRNKITFGKIIAKIPSKTGMHFITTSFDVREFAKSYPDIEIHRDNPTNLYIP